MKKNTNILKVTGSVVGKEVAYTNKKYDETFYTLTVEVVRRSQNMDVLPIIVSEKLLLGNKVKEGDLVTIVGQVRTRNFRDESGRNHLQIFGYATDIELIDLAGYIEIEDKNVVELDGFICKKPINRTTSNTGRVITDLIVAVNRKYNRSDYLPVITWGRNAKMAANFHVGDEVKVTGRFQSRSYKKKDEETVHTVYEVSAINVELLGEKEQTETTENSEGNEAARIA